jgi:type VI secretion system protein ImpM
MKRDGLPLASGFWGKLPSRGDFVGRGLPADWVQRWDTAWQAGLAAAAQARAPQALRDALAGMATWRYLASDGTQDSAGGRCWCGLVTASQDRVGRVFPLTLVEAWSAGTLASATAVQTRLDRLHAMLPLALAAEDDAPDRLAAALRSLASLPLGGDMAAAPDPAAAAALAACRSATCARAWWAPADPTSAIAAWQEDAWPPSGGFIAERLLAPL